MTKTSGLNYLDIQRNIKAINKRYKIQKYIETCLLDAIYDAHLEGHDIRVLDLLLLEEIASQASLHAGIKSLEKKGLASLDPNPNDGRIKHVHPTKLALKRLDELEMAISKCRK